MSSFEIGSHETANANNSNSVSRNNAELKVFTNNNTNTDNNEANAKDADLKVARHMRVRYWTSWEEMRLVELWRRYNTEVLTLQKNIPVFRKISEGMRECGLNLNPQECRRKINVINNKYIDENRRIKSSEDYKHSDWKLYPLVHCLMEPKDVNSVLTHEQQIISELIAKIPLPSSDSDCVNDDDYAFYKALNLEKITKSVNHNQNYRRPTPYERRSNLANKTKATIASILKRNISLANLENIQEENRILTAERDDALKSLQNEQREFDIFLAIVTKFELQQEQIIQNLANLQ